MSRMSIAILILVAITSCRNPSSPYLEVREFTPDELELLSASDEFGLRLFREVAAEEGAENIFISPFSVSMALGMTANGAAGATLDAMRSTLSLSQFTRDESNQAYLSLIEYLPWVDSQVQFDIANSIWYRESWTFKDDFYQRTADYFKATVKGLNFSDPAAAGEINGWVSDNTS